MREIKFRAWDKYRQEMTQPHDGDFIKWHAPSNWKDCYTVMQYTGLKDKNGVEIYEGDVVVFGDNVIHEGIHGQVIFSQAHTIFVYKFLDGDHKGSLTDMHDTWRTYEVIGNIHENGDLLE